MVKNKNQPDVKLSNFLSTTITLRRKLRNHDDDREILPCTPSFKNVYTNVTVKLDDEGNEKLACKGSSFISANRQMRCSLATVPILPHVRSRDCVMLNSDIIQLYVEFHFPLGEDEPISNLGLYFIGIKSARGSNLFPSAAFFMLLFC